MLTPEQAAFLLEMMQTKGIVFPLERCRIAAETQDALLVIVRDDGHASPITAISHHEKSPTQ